MRSACHRRSWTRKSNIGDYHCSLILTTYVPIHSDLCKFIASGRLACTIDKVSGVITTNRVSAENKTVAYESVVKQGDLLLNGERRCRL